MNNENNSNVNENSEQQFAGRVNIGSVGNKNFHTEEAFKALRTNILFKSADIKTILVTSCIPGEGKSTVSKDLAKSFAELGKKTLLIDADLRKSVILKNKSQNVLGLSELISSQATVNKVLYKTQIDNLDIVFTGNFPPNPVELLSNSVFESEINKFKDIYDIIIIDTPPLLPVIDAAVIGRVCDGALIVVAPSMVKATDIKHIKEQIEKSGCNVLGVVVNEVNSAHKDLSKPYKRDYYYYSDGAKKGQKRSKSLNK